MAKRRAGSRSDRQHGCHTRHEGEIDIAPFGGAAFDRLANCRRHGENAGIAAGHHAHLAAGSCKPQSLLGAGNLLAIGRSVATLVRPKRQPVNVREITEKIVRSFNGSERFRRYLGLTARAKTDDDEPARHDFSPAKGLVFQPGTRTSEKYGAGDASRSTSRTAWLLAMVPRST